MKTPNISAGLNVVVLAAAILAAVVIPEDSAEQRLDLRSQREEVQQHAERLGWKRGNRGLLRKPVPEQPAFGGCQRGRLRPVGSKVDNVGNSSRCRTRS